LFSSAKEMKDAISRIVTDSRAPGEAKDPDNSHLFTLYQAFATKEQSNEFRADLLQGLGWGEAKQRLFQLLDAELGEARENYLRLIERPSDLEDILQAGAQKARRIATPFLGELREAVGLRSFRAASQTVAATKKKSSKGARFVSFREDDGSFRFRLLAAEGEQLLLSRNFADGKSAGAVTKQLQQGGALDIRAEAESFTLWLDGACVADSPTFADAAARDAAIESLKLALAPQQD
jgi:tryptophanyl-tRNA synthetase